jgi:hypothetical protein
VVLTKKILGEIIMASHVRHSQTLHRRPAIQLDGIRRRHGGQTVVLGVVGIMQELQRARSSTASNHRPAFVGEPW